jgi:hypothetical protein
VPDLKGIVRWKRRVQLSWYFSWPSSAFFVFGMVDTSCVMHFSFAKDGSLQLLSARLHDVRFLIIVTFRRKHGNISLKSRSYCY